MDSEHHHSKKNSSQSALVAVMAIIIVVLAGSTFYFYHKDQQDKRALSAQPGKFGMMSGYGQGRFAAPSGMMRQGGGRMMMRPMPTPTLTAQQDTQISAGPSKDTTVKTFDVNGGNFYFTPNKLTVNKGDKVTIVFHDDGGMHNFILDEFNVKTDTIQGGNTTTVTFTADKVGSFQYYCSIGRHKQLGMTGTLIVQ